MNVEYHLLLIPSKLHLTGFERVTEKPTCNRETKIKKVILKARHL